MNPDRFAERRFDSDLVFHVPPAPGGGGITSAQPVVERVIETFSRSVRDEAARSRAIARGVAEWERAIDEELGSDVWRRLTDYSRTRGRLSRAPEDIRPGRLDTARLAERQAEAKELSHGLLRELGVDRGAVRQIHERAAAQMAEALSPAPAGDRRLEVSTEDDVPVSIRQGSVDSWFVKKAPFDGSSWYYSWHKWGGKVTQCRSNVEILENPFTYITGQFGHLSRYQNTSAGDYDGLWLNAKSSVGFWYKAPQAGQRLVWLKIRARKARLSIYLEDEWGWSSSTTNCWSRLNLDVTQVSGLEGQTENWHLSLEGSPDSDWFHLDWLAPDSVVWVPVTVDLPPDWVYIAVGAEDHRQTGVNDVSTDQTMDSRYVLEEAWIEE